MIIVTKAYGPIEIDENQVYLFPYGLPGFDKFTKWALFEAKQEPFFILQSLEDENIAFFLLDPLFFDVNYGFEIDTHDLEFLKIDRQTHTSYSGLVIVNIPQGNPTNMTANLQAPIIFNVHQKIAGQCISINPKWQIQHPLIKNKVKEEL